MKQQTTIKDLKRRFNNKAIQLYCSEGQCLFNEYDADYYNSGVYGWNFDAFTVNGYVITRGYRNTFGVEPDSDLIKEYNDKAIEVKRTLTDCNEIRWEIYELQKEFINKVFKKEV